MAHYFEYFFSGIFIFRVSAFIKSKIEDNMKLSPFISLGASTTCVLFTVLLEEREMMIAYLTVILGLSGHNHTQD
jgi:hypothetical protein